MSSRAGAYFLTKTSSPALSNWVSFKNNYVYPQQVSDSWSNNLMGTATLTLTIIQLCFNIFYLSALINISLYQLNFVLWKKMFLKISQISQENTCWILFLINLQALGLQFFKKRLRHRCFPVNIAKLLRARILKNSCKLQLLFIRQYEKNPQFPEKSIKTP